MTPGCQQLPPLGAVSLPSETLDGVQKTLIERLPLVFNPEDDGVKA